MSERISETALYAPVKAFLEAQGFEVKAEIGPADVVALRGGEAPVIVELKATFSLTLLHQAVARLAVTDRVYVAVPRKAGRASWKATQANVRLCRRLGLGVLTVRMKDGLVELLAEPGPFAPRKSPRKKASLLREFDRRRGDPNEGGTRGAIVTAYRQDAEACAVWLFAQGAARGRDVRDGAGVARATRMMADNHYGWFLRIATGVYDLTDEGRAAAEALRDRMAAE